MKNLVRWNEALRNGLRLKNQEDADVDKLPRTLATKVSAPVGQPLINADTKALHTVRQQVHGLQQQHEESKITLDTHT